MDPVIRKKHALIIPVSLQAHFFAIYGHAVGLAKRGVTISFVGLGKDIALLRTFEELEGLDFNLVSYQDFGSETFVSCGDPVSDVLEFLRQAKSYFQPIFDKLLADYKAGLPGPTCIIGDWFLTWALHMAKELSIPYYQFYSCGAIYPRLLQAYVSLIAEGILSYETGPLGGKILTEFDGFIEIPGLPPLQSRDMAKPPPTDTSGVPASTDLAIGVAVDKADGLIVNSFYELESPQIDALQQSWKQGPQGTIPKLYLVGPVSVAATFKDRSLTADLKNAGSDCMRWLDHRPPQSVVYIAVGTVARLVPHQITKLAQALEASEHSFLWLLKTGEEHLPPNFATRMIEKGLIVNGWVPRLQVLQHTSIGGFVTHCGWNSIGESVASGVPMAAWPQMNNDQFINCRHLVDVLKVAVEVRSEDSRETTITTGTRAPKYLGLEKAVRLLLSEEGNSLRARVQDLRKKAEAAVANGGASKKALSDLVQSIPS